MDQTDQKLVAALRRDGRASISDLAAALRLSRATVRARIAKLEAAGEIVGFTVVLKGDASDLPVRGIMLVTIEGKGTNRVIDALGGMPEVRAIHTTNGRWDLIVELGADSLSDLDSVLGRIRLIDGIANTETNLVLSTRRTSRTSAASA